MSLTPLPQNIILNKAADQASAQEKRYRKASRFAEADAFLNAYYRYRAQQFEELCAWDTEWSMMWEDELRRRG